MNAIQRRAAPDLKRANDAYVRLSRGERRGRRQVDELGRAEAAIRVTRSKIAAVDAPEPAAELHASLVRAFDVNAGLAAETAVLGRYLPGSTRALGPLEKASERLDRVLSRPGPAAQAAGLDRYGEELGRAIARLRRLSPPPVLAAAHREQGAQLRRTRQLAGRLATAIADRDPKAAAQRLLAFRRARRPPGVSSLTRRALAAYQVRRREVLRASAEIVRRRVELEREIEGT